MLNTPHHLTPRELARLRGIASTVCTTHDEPRHTCTKDASDTAGPCVTTYTDAPGEVTREPVPWRIVLEMEP